jgi:hypothetical protein
MVEAWQEWAVPATAWLLTYLMHSTLLIAAVWLTSRRLDHRPAALDALWKTALVGGLVTATLQTASGVSPWGGRLDLVARAGGPTATGAEIQPSQKFDPPPAPLAFAGIFGARPDREAVPEAVATRDPSGAAASARSAGPRAPVWSPRHRPGRFWPRGRRPIREPARRRARSRWRAWIRERARLRDRPRHRDPS